MTPSATVKNEAAERLAIRISNWPINSVRKQEGYHDLDAALRAERLATRARIRERCDDYGVAFAEDFWDAFVDAEVER